MFRLTIVLCVLIELIRAKSTVYTQSPKTLSEKIDKLVDKVERFSVLPSELSDINSIHYDKFDQLNSLNINLEDNGLSDEEEIILADLQQGGGLTVEELDEFAKDLQDLREKKQSNLMIDKVNEDDLDDGWVEPQDEEEDYVMDRDVLWDTYEDRDEMSTAMPKLLLGSTAERDGRFPEESESRPEESEAKLEESAAVFRPGIESISTVIDPIAATAARPIILSDAGISTSSIKKAALVNMGVVVRSAKCLTPQPRWLQVRQLAPAANTIYMPPCVQLHRCAPDSGCCDNEAEMCAPVDGKHVEIALFIKKSDNKLSVVRMLFYNHTQCACLPRDNPRPLLYPRSTAQADVEARDEEPANLRTAPPEVHGFSSSCTCPGLFQAAVRDRVCSCQCDWLDPKRRNDCSSLARGKEHFGLKDRWCIEQGTCTVPSCKYGEYDRETGKCPRRFRKLRSQYRNRP